MMTTELQRFISWLKFGAPMYWTTFWSYVTQKKLPDSCDEDADLESVLGVDRTFASYELVSNGNNQ